MVVQNGGRILVVRKAPELYFPGPILESKNERLRPERRSTLALDFYNIANKALTKRLGPLGELFRTDKSIC